jgi:hypothetical protein
MKYLYLSEVEWSNAWINGGEIPISLASTYINKERDGILTPDENLIHESPVNLKGLSPFLHFAEGASIRHLTITNSRFNGVRIPDIVNAGYYVEDGLILSFCNSLSGEVAKKLKKKACVKITNIEKLRKSIDRQLGFKGIMKECEYTNGHQRNHFLKSVEDSWQDEYRIFWKYPTNKVVKIPSGLAEFVCEF